jgi:hypothetical protein
MDTTGSVANEPIEPRVNTFTDTECLYKVHTTQFADAATLVGNGIVSYIVPAIQYDDTW